jgi:hypothetical protein
VVFSTPLTQRYKISESKEYLLGITITDEKGADILKAE